MDIFVLIGTFTIVCLAGIRYFDLWHDAMITLNMTLVATILVMILAL